MKTIAKILLLTLILFPFLVSAVIGQPLRDPKPEPDSTLNIQYLINPSFQTLLPVSAKSVVSNPFPKQGKIPAKLLFELGSAFLKGSVDEPFNAPNYGTGTPPPLNFIRPENITDYELMLERINRQTIGTQ